jgi:hypothetical protein
MLMPAILHVAGKVIEKIILPAGRDKLAAKYKDLLPVNFMQ